MFLDFNTPESKNNKNHKILQGIGNRAVVPLVIFNLVFCVFNLYYITHKTAQIYPKTPVVIQCTKADIEELKRSSDILESIQKDLENNTI